MKKILLAVVLSVSAVSAFAEEKTLILATDGAYPPFAEIGADGKMTGFDIDIGMALCKEMQRKCEFRQVDWDALIPALQNEKIDAIVASMNANAERRKVIGFTIPYYRNSGIWVRRKGSNIEVSDAGLKGQKIGVLTASIWDDYATEKYGKIAKIDRYNTQDDANIDAVKGVVGVLFSDKIVLKNGFLDRDIGKDFEAFGPEMHDPKYIGEGKSIGIRKGGDALREAFNKAIKAIRDNGEYQKINDKYFSYDIYGSDAP